MSSSVTSDLDGGALGAPRTLLLLHGSPGTGQAWAGVAVALTGTRRPLMPTLPGHAGDAPHPGGVAAIADRIAPVIAEAPGPVALVGYSFGGVVAIELASRGLDIDRLLLLEPTAVPALRDAGDAAAYAEAERVFGAYIEAARRGVPDAIGTMVDFWFGPGAFGAMPERVRAGLNAAAPRNAEDVAATFAERYDAARLARLPADIEIVIGGNSPPVARAIAEALRRLAPRIRITSLPGANHAMLQTHAADLAARIDAFCR